MNGRIFEKTEVTERAEQYGRKAAENGHCTIEKDNDYCIIFKAAARTRFNVFIPGLIITGRTMTVYKHEEEGYLHIDETAINCKYLLERGGLNPLMTIELAAL